MNLYNLKIIDTNQLTFLCQFNLKIYLLPIKY